MKMRTSLVVGVGIVLATALVFVFGPTKGSRAGEGSQIILYTGVDFTGKSMTLQSDVYDFPLTEEPDKSLFDWNDQIRSIVVVRGTWRLYQNGRCNTRLDETTIDHLDVTTKDPDDGWSTLVTGSSGGQFAIPDLSQAGIGPDVSSIELISDENLPDWAMGMRNSRK